MSKKQLLRLNTCPFCGSAAGIQKDITGEEKYHAVCNDSKLKCPMFTGLPTWSDSEEEAAASWNGYCEQHMGDDGLTENLSEGD